MLSTNALFAIGINYGGSGGNPLEKLHPSLYVLLIALALSLFSSTSASRNHPLAQYRLFSIAMIAASVVMMVWTVISPNAGGELSGPIVTFLLPGVLLYVLTRSPVATIAWIAAFVPLFLTANSLFGLFSYITGVRLLPQMAGALIVFDPRPTALLGHPLVNAQITGIFLLYLLLKSIATRFTMYRILGVLLHGTALIAFGGRSALAMVVVISAVYGVHKVYSGLAIGKASSLISVSILLFATALGLPLAIQAGFTETLLERLVDDGGSANTRLAAIQMLGYLDFQQWVLGAGPAQRNLLQIALQTPFGIENFIVALTVTYGVLVTLVIVVATFAALLRLAKPLKGPGTGLVIYFFLTSLTSLSLGSKTTITSLFICVLIALQNPVRKAFPKGSPVVSSAVLPKASRA